jgi:hypothetical protein
MGTLKERLILKALRRHPRIFPCETRESFARSFTRQSGRMVFWYNTEDNSTHIVSEKIPVRRRTTVRKSRMGAGVTPKHRVLRKSLPRRPSRSSGT